MAKITYVEFSGAEHVLDVKPGLSVMEGAVKNNVPGIDAAPPATFMWTRLGAA